jgi:ferredoxin
MVVGGGNSAVEAANVLAENGARVSISYRQENFFRITAMNRSEINSNISSGRVTAYFNTTPTAITAEAITLKTAAGSETMRADEVFILAGAEPPRKLLRQLGLAFENEWGWPRAVNMAAVIALVWLYYAFAKWGDGSGVREFPFSLLGKSWEVLPGWINLGIATSLLYTLVVLGFGIPALARWRSMPRISSYQTARYLVMFISQTLFLFLLPEYFLRLWDSAEAWRFYGIVMPFPLSYEVFFERPSLFWISMCVLAAGAALPIIIYRHGKRFCSWVCGCACLAETLGDRYRHYAPRGEFSRKIENPLMWCVLIWAIASAGLFLYLQGGVGHRPWYVAAYSYVVDFWLAGVFGVGLYFFMGNRIWCRYFCPLAHYLRLLSAWYGKFRIKPADRCIACGECSRYCQMGIDVMKWALKQAPVTNRNSSCIGCGVCVSVCPMDNLTMGERFPNEENYTA